MNTRLTPWGYDLRTGEPLPELLSVAEFQASTNGKYTDQTRITAALRAASATIRDFCGWHVFPLLPCRFVASLYDLRIARVRDELLIQLPAKFVPEVTSVTLDGETVTGYTAERTGLLHLYDLPHMPRHPRAVLSVDYSAGLDDQSAAAIRDIAASRAVHGLSGTAGVQSEAAGGVSVTYNAGWVQAGGASALSPIDAQTLNAWRLQGVL